MSATDLTAASRSPVVVGVLATSVGGTLGALARWAIGTTSTVEPGQFPWTTWWINVTGTLVLAMLPLVPAVRVRPWLGLLLGTGVLGGFTTMSAASVETFALLEGGHVTVALLYLGGTFGAALLAVLAVDHWTTPEVRRGFEDSEGDE